MFAGLNSSINVLNRKPSLSIAHIRIELDGKIELEFLSSFS
jgi:hypothetical protein